MWVSIMTNEVNKKQYFWCVCIVTKGTKINLIKRTVYNWLEMLPWVLGLGEGRNERRKWYSGRWVKWTVTGNLNLKVSRKWEKGGTKIKVNTRAVDYKGLSSPKAQNFIQLPYENGGRHRTGDNLLSISRLCFMGYWFICCFYYTYEVLRTGSGTSKALN